MKPKQLIKDVTFDFEKDETKCGPHIAYTLPSQGGAASGLNVGYMFKSDNVSEESVKEAEEIQKALSMAKTRKILENALKEAFADKEDWLYVEDWVDNKVYFSTGECYSGWEMMVADFTITEDGMVTVGDTATPVLQITDYMMIDGKVKLSETAEDKLESGMYQIVSKSINKPEAQEQLIKSVQEFKESLDAASTAVSKGVDVNKTKNVENKLDFKEIMKSADFQELLKSMKDEIKAEAQAEVKVDLEKAQAKAAEAEEIIKAAEKVQEKEFTELVKSASFIKEDEVTATVSFLMKSRTKTEDHNLVMSIIKNAQETIAAMQEEVTKTKDQFALSEVGKDGQVKPIEIDPQEIIKAKAAKWAEDNKSK